MRIKLNKYVMAISILAIASVNSVHAQSIPTPYLGIGYWYYQFMGSGNGTKIGQQAWAGSCSLGTPAVTADSIPGIPDSALTIVAWNKARTAKPTQQVTIGGKDCFQNHTADIKAAGLDIARIGGTSPNVNLNTNAGTSTYFNPSDAIPDYDLVIKRMKDAGARPLVQIPININGLASAGSVSTTYTQDLKNFVQLLINHNVQYVSIGNEPDLINSTSPTNRPASGNYADKGVLMATAPSVNDWACLNKTDANDSDNCVMADGKTPARLYENTYKEFKNAFISIANYVKQKMPGVKIIGADFANPYGSYITNPKGYFADYISDVGSRIAKDANGRPLATPAGDPLYLLDVLSFHFYNHMAESDVTSRLNTLQGYIDNLHRPKTQPLQMGVGEVNGKYNSACSGPVTSTKGEGSTPCPYTTSGNGFNKDLVPDDGYSWSFDAGHQITTLTKAIAAKGGAYVIPWAVYDSGDVLSMYNVNGTPNSMNYHLTAMKQKNKSFYMPISANNTNLDDQLVVYGTTDGTGSTVIAMNATGGKSPKIFDAKTLTYTLNFSSNGDFSAGFRVPDYSLSARDRMGALLVNKTAVNLTASPTLIKENSTASFAGPYVMKIPAKTTQITTYDSYGNRLKKWVYDQTSHNKDFANISFGATAVNNSTVIQTKPIAPPIETDLTIKAPTVSVNNGVVTVTVVVQPGAEPRAGYNFILDDGSVIGSTTAPSSTTTPITFTFTSNNNVFVADGNHKIRVQGVDADGNVDTGPNTSFTYSGNKWTTAQNITIGGTSSIRAFGATAATPARYTASPTFTNTGSSPMVIQISLGFSKPLGTTPYAIQAELRDSYGNTAQDFNALYDLPTSTVIVPDLCPGCTVSIPWALTYAGMPISPSSFLNNGTGGVAFKPIVLMLNN